MKSKLKRTISRLIPTVMVIGAILSVAGCGNSKGGITNQSDSAHMVPTTTSEVTTTSSAEEKLLDTNASPDDKDNEDVKYKESEIKNTYAWPAATNAQVGDIITFGTYEQDNNTSNGKEPIEWVVLDTKEGNALVISRYVLNSSEYEESFTDAIWENCLLRNWLNHVFLYEAFSAEEQEFILETNVINNDNPYYGTPGGNDTNDLLFCLSLEEINTYYGWTDNKEINAVYGWTDDNMVVYGANEMLVTNATPYADACGVHTSVIENQSYYGYLKYYNYSKEIIGREGAWWWLRSPGNETLSPLMIDHGGYIRSDYRAGYSDIGVRPALWLKL